LVLADAVYRDDVGVVQARCRLGLALKALLMSGIEEGADRQNLEGDAPSERLLLGLIDDPHAAAADLAQNAIIADPIQASALGHGQGDGGSYRLVEYITLEILQSDDGGKAFADFIDQLGIPADVVVEIGAFTAPQSVLPLIGQLSEQVGIYIGLGHTGLSSRVSPGVGFRNSALGPALPPLGGQAGGNAA